MNYDHGPHAGNAGDVWKHLILAETADHLFQDEMRIYVESHVGFPEYRLSRGGEWEGGVGRCGSKLESLSTFPYFQILSEANPKNLELYLGSARLVLELARLRGQNIRAELWDQSPLVARSWSRHDERGFQVSLHQGDGFFGAMELAEERDFALLLIDPPYIDERDAKAAEDLLSAAVKAGWVALCWYMTDQNEPPRPSIPFETFCLRFKDAGLEGGRWEGAAVIVAGGDRSLIGWLERRTNEFLEVLTDETSQSF